MVKEKAYIRASNGFWVKHVNMKTGAMVLTDYKGEARGWVQRGSIQKVIDFCNQRSVQIGLGLTFSYD